MIAPPTAEVLTTTISVPKMTETLLITLTLVLLELPETMINLILELL